MRIVPALLILPLLALAGCSRSNDVYEELPNSSLAGAPRADVTESRMDAPVARPVMIGEDGPQFPACGTRGHAIIMDDPNSSDDESFAELRVAPFAEARSQGRLDPSTSVYVCTRSLDQKWLGVVLQPAVSGKTEITEIDERTGKSKPWTCGVSGPVAKKRAYDGPCPSGWVSSAYIRLVG